MKTFFFRIIFTICFCFLHPECGIAQGYVPFPTDSAFWRMDRYEQCPPSNQIPAAKFQYFIVGDTVINLITYKKLLVTGIGDCFPTLGYFAGSFRDDSIARKIFFIRPGSNIVELLYDFNLLVGDTIKGYFDDGQNHTVELVDSVNLGGVNRKRIKFHALNLNPFFIEGIGSVSGLIDPIEQIGFDCVLVCYSHKGNTIYPDSVSGCNIINKTAEVNHPINIFINPNPIVDESYISIENNKINKIEIYDITGQLILSEKLNTSQVLIKKNLLKAGIYFCKVETLNNNLYVIKLISQ